jgi:hypothetical protein
VAKTVLLWTIAFLVTAFSAVYQRMTGPTWPEGGTVQFAGSEIEYSLETTWEGDTDQRVAIPVGDPGITGTLEWRRHGTNEAWQGLPMTREGEELAAYLPNQPPAGKLNYRVKLASGSDEIAIPGEGYIVTRFKGVVPGIVLLPHVLIMFIGMLFSTRTGLEAIFKRNNIKRLTIWTFGLLFVGGMILGPIMQYLAFGDWWTGVPFGWDLTDNKTLIAMIAWAWALWAVIKKGEEAGTPALVASIITIVIFLIPHSLLGSELDYTAEGM